ncbi:MAG: TerD family protein [Alphaproteobacteria bacterium]
MSEPRIPKGETVPLNVTQKARWRVFAGLGWDPNEEVSLKDKAMGALGLRDNHHDLDLSCYVFDKDGRYITHVSVEEGREADQTGQIYHSGDNVEGVGEGDDEQISVELDGLDAAIHAIVFKASIKTGHGFNDVRDPEIRLADGYSGHSFLHVSLRGVDNNDKPAFVFAALLRGADEQWMARHIGEFIDAPKDGDWAGILKRFVP